MSSFGISDLITLTRASEAWFFNSAGLLEKAAVDVPRFEYDPVTQTIKGLLIEEQRTNSLLHNRDLSESVWTKNGTPSPTQNQTGIDGVANKAWTLTDSDGSSFEWVLQSITVSDDSATHSASAYIKKNSGDEANGFPTVKAQLLNGTILEHSVNIDTRDGSNDSVNKEEDGSHTVYDAGDWWRIDIQITNNSSGNTSFRFHVFPAHTTTLGGTANNSATGTVVYDFGQIELNETLSTSPIETSASAVTRSADKPTGTIGDEFNADEFSYVVTVFSAPGSAGFMDAIDIDDGSGGNRVFINRNAIAGDRLELRTVSSAGSNGQANTSVNLADVTEAKIAIRIKEGDMAICVNGGTVQKDTDAAQPTGLTTRRVGFNFNNGGYWNGHIKLLREIPRALSDQELQSESTL